MHPAVIGKALADFLHHGDLPADRTTVLQGGYGIARYTRRYLRAHRPAQIVNGAYQYGAIGRTSATRSAWRRRSGTASARRPASRGTR